MKHKNFTLGVFCPGGVLSWGFLSEGFLSGGICPGGFCPRTYKTLYWAEWPQTSKVAQKTECLCVTEDQSFLIISYLPRYSYLDFDFLTQTEEQ